MKTLARAISLTHHDLPVFVRQNWALLLGTFVGCELADSYFVWAGHMLGEAAQMNMPLALARFCVAFIELAILTLLVPVRLNEQQRKLPPHAFWHYATHYAGPLTLESLRALGFTLLWSLLFIIPGLIKYLQYQFVPFVVLCEPAYEDGKVDALKRSKELTKGIMTLLIGLLLCGAALSWGLGYVEEAHSLDTSPVIWFCTFVANTALNLYLSVLLYEVYRVRVDGLPVSSANFDHKEVV